MSSDGDAADRPSTTTLSTVAVQTGNAQVVVAVLKCGERLTLQLTEAKPDFLEIGGDHHEAKRLLDDHEQLLDKLKRNEGRVRALLGEADKAADEKKGEEKVYEAMAVSLSAAWDMLMLHLEKRRSLLLLACDFFQCAVKFASKMDEAEDFRSSAHEQTFLQRHSLVRKEMLQSSMLVLNKSCELLDMLKDLEAEQMMQDDKASHQAWRSSARIEGLLEVLQDRCRHLDLCMKKHHSELETLHDKPQLEEQQVAGCLDKGVASEHGGSLDLNQEHKELEWKNKEQSLKGEHMLKQASGLLSSSRDAELQLPSENQQMLKRGNTAWKCEENLTTSDCCLLCRDEIGELRELFKDLRKNCNNLKMDYSKSKNSKTTKTQMEQIDVYVEKLQVLKEQLHVFSQKVSGRREGHSIGNCSKEIPHALNELQRQVRDFDRAVDAYKQNLDMNVKLQQALAEYQFWSDEAISTIIRVGKYSSQCKTQEAVTYLYKQFEKFVSPTVPQQEERINQITELAVQIHGPAEGKRYMEKTVMKHHQIVESIKELSNGLLDLEAKLQLETSKRPQTPEDQRDVIDTLKTEKPLNQRPGRPEQPKATSLYAPQTLSTMTTVETLTGRSTVTVKVPRIPVQSSRRWLSSQQTRKDSQATTFSPKDPPSDAVTSNRTEVHSFTKTKDQGLEINKTPSDFKTGVHLSIEEKSQHVGSTADADLHLDLFTEESFSNDEYECTSPDDISLPPLSETPESNIILSENDLDDPCCSSSHGHQLSQHQSHSRHSRSSPTSASGVRFRAESSHFVQSPVTAPAPSRVSNTISTILKSKSQFVENPETECRGVGNVMPSAPITDSDSLKPPILPGEVRRGPSSEAVVMDGSLVTLEMEVTGFPEPALTWWVAHSSLDL